MKVIASDPCDNCSQKSYKNRQCLEIVAHETSILRVENRNGTNYIRLEKDEMNENRDVGQ